MRVAAFSIGMVGSAAGVGVLALWSGFSGWAVAGLVAATMVLAQVLYLALILLMIREESDRRQPADPAKAPAETILQIRKPHQPNV
ncbi:hypothetical protein LAZ29_20655 [Cereibacter sphaeroides]|uniref:hypothetical protein n=1 Tax=Cereibacter sphaeroides TaxID=1063 RepID=UPI001F245167|nr:hypothetical protein [Cereibacter sphaeroides]MCE6953344.1 hypothetical protein [Cereibacter sphaeroides]